MRKKEKCADSKWNLRNLFCCCSNQGNFLDARSENGYGFYRLGLKTGVKNDIIWSEIRPGLENRAAHPHREFPGVPPRALLIIKEDYKIMISPNFTRNPRRLLFPVYVFQCCHDTSHLFEAS